MHNDDLLLQLETVLPIAALCAAWAAYLLASARWLRGVRRIQLFR